MESNKQEKSNLLNDNPIARRAGGSWISKHSIAAGSPLHKGGSALYQEKPDPKSLINAKGQSQDDVMKSRETDYNTANKSLTDFQGKIKNLTFGSQGEVDTANNEQSRLLNATNERADAYNTSNDSISNVNKAYNKKVTAYNNSIAPTQMNQAPTMKKGSMAYKQGYNDRLDESLGTKNGQKSQSLKDRRDESKGMEKSKGKGAYSSDSQMS